MPCWGIAVKTLVGVGNVLFFLNFLCCGVSEIDLRLVLVTS
jgi:hypothetical protein